MARTHRHLWRDIVGFLNPTFKSVKIEGDDALQLTDSATVWEDIQTSLIGRRLASNTGRVDYDYTNGAVKFQNNGDVTSDNNSIQMNIQIPHSAKMSEMRLHLHWWQTSSNAVTWTTRYRIQTNGEAQTTAWTETSVTVGTDPVAFTYTSGTLNQIMALATIDISSSNLSSIVQIRFAREDSTAGDVYATFLDLHYERDALGSNGEYTKSW